jgi:hypothetical protein
MRVIQRISIAGSQVVTEGKVNKGAIVSESARGLINCLPPLFSSTYNNPVELR